MKWYIYKCNAKNQLFHEGDWSIFFKEEPKDKTWGNTRRIPALNILNKGDRIIATQTDRKELVGTCEFLSRSADDNIHLKWTETIEQKITPLKIDDPLGIGKIPALQPSFPHTLYDISKKDARMLLGAARRSKIAAELELREGEKRSVKTSIRNPKLRAEAKLKYGLSCYCCGFEFALFYGDFAKNVGIVHHLKQFDGKSRKVTVKDVRVVCANCHQIIHIARKPIHVDTLKKKISARWMSWSRKGLKSKR